MADETNAEDEVINYVQLVIVDTVEAAFEVIRHHELETTSKFSVRSCREKNFGNTDYNPNDHCILWQEKSGKGIPFNGIPFIVVNNLYFDCANGPERHHNFKRKFAEKKEEQMSEGVPAKKRRLSRGCQKMNCTAVLRLTEVIYFPDYKIEENRDYRKASTSKKLRSVLREGKELVLQERKIYVRLPAPSDHCNHTLGEEGGHLQKIDRRLKMKIAELVGNEQITDTAEIRRRLSEFVEKDLFYGCAPVSTNRRFYPTDVDIRNHVHLAAKKLGGAVTLNRRKSKTIPQLKQEEEAARVVVDGVVAEEIIYYISSDIVSPESTDSIEQSQKITLTDGLPGNGTSFAILLQPNPSTKIIPQQNLGASCREKLTDINKRTLNVHEDAVLEQLNEKLTDILLWLNACTYNQGEECVLSITDQPAHESQTAIIHIENGEIQVKGEL